MILALYMLNSKFSNINHNIDLVVLLMPPFKTMEVVMFFIQIESSVLSIYGLLNLLY